MSKKRSRVEINGDGISVDNTEKSAGREEADILAAEEKEHTAEAHHNDRADEKDGGQSSDDEAPEEMSKVAAATQAGRRRKAEIEARPRAPKRNRGKVSKQQGKGGDVDESRELELPSELLAVVKSKGLERAEREEASRKKSEALKAAASVTSAKSVPRRTPKVENVKRRDNFQLVVLGGDSDVDGVLSKPHAVDSAKNFLRQRKRKQRRVNGVLFEARRRLGPSPYF